MLLVHSVFALTLPYNGLHQTIEKRATGESNRPQRWNWRFRNPLARMATTSTASLIQTTSTDSFIQTTTASQPTLRSILGNINELGTIQEGSSNSGFDEDSLSSLDFDYQSPIPSDGSSEQMPSTSDDDEHESDNSNRDSNSSESQNDLDESDEILRALQWVDGRIMRLGDQTTFTRSTSTIYICQEALNSLHNRILAQRNHPNFEMRRNYLEEIAADLAVLRRNFTTVRPSIGPVEAEWIGEIDDLPLSTTSSAIPFAEATIYDPASDESEPEIHAYPVD